LRQIYENIHVRRVHGFTQYLSRCVVAPPAVGARGDCPLHFGPGAVAGTLTVRIFRFCYIEGRNGQIFTYLFARGDSYKFVGGKLNYRMFTVRISLLLHRLGRQEGRDFPRSVERRGGRKGKEKGGREGGKGRRRGRRGDSNEFTILA
jgi:hypothetical protein